LTILFSFGILALLAFSLHGKFEAYAISVFMNESVIIKDNIVYSNTVVHDIHMMSYSMINQTMDHDMSNNTMRGHDSMMSMNHVDTPLKQVKNGILPHDVKCEEGYELVFKVYDGSPACVKSSIASILIMEDGQQMRVTR
jgi:hypothetical protein